MTDHIGTDNGRNTSITDIDKFRFGLRTVQFHVRKGQIKGLQTVFLLLLFLKLRHKRIVVILVLVTRRPISESNLLDILSTKGGNLTGIGFLRQYGLKFVKGQSNRGEFILGFVVGTGKEFGIGGKGARIFGLGGTDKGFVGPSIGANAQNQSGKGRGKINAQIGIFARAQSTTDNGGLRTGATRHNIFLRHGWHASHKDGVLKLVANPLHLRRGGGIAIVDIADIVVVIVIVIFIFVFVILLSIFIFFIVIVKISTFIVRH
mmetsp:Transcript_28264/g.59127  ORF Transcript_28264/g.59127 Transcript_28264/m.59127 type:complete len:262 (-) Transcript_28264:1096-1881(-)